MNLDRLNLQKFDLLKLGLFSKRSLTLSILMTSFDLLVGDSPFVVPAPLSLTLDLIISILLTAIILVFIV